ncbi:MULTISPECIES: bifunctional glutamate N-acetyltransferase/amino-acid acetyltransferase ArgJ [Marivita]|uniref:Arginine biosynthesis bifunctional protein ArgJ n=1 Tax=Marivita cryptomonadis TaxID=505252 RepID=A0A9Q2RZM5_9RHOB|nr:MULTISPECIES: bifunctional glutamate N-acetyltransferase/amino-acid acetyltransferase ArgJ [Marivita]MBM2321647.1 bifunctional glutamate N-acetyltransferase/amino-acid acetyltransferase ArgJ [Marivita cryptomonadis]MBM2331228.1 bifunctional glutamate N-acetyltransferase/amino-acid acetyltransferase ArgJ [Marivita cryptomonadis]MBM2340814.1 bifunctional glutamate N-acetyltransferase/amino-acid acetyltransferase ArgJ [Marivita cryptomonadis]MBM2345476.1 bifunctional glutamate N-acetyltransfera
MAKITSVSPLAPASFPKLPVIKGARFSTAAAGVKYAGRTDVMLAVLDPGSCVAGAFTKSATRSANVLDCQSKIRLEDEGGAAIIVNSGNSNAFTGRAGDESVQAICAEVAHVTGLPSSRVFTSSTGVIGERLPHDRIKAKVEELYGNLDEAGLPGAAKAIMTTDTFPKGSTTSIDLPDGTVTIAGIAKGSGMIAPDMATMLVYIFTDAKIAQSDLQTLVSEINEKTFNSITVDSDTSTSDTLLVAATGASDVTVTPQDAAFRDGLHHVMQDLAHQVVRDGEGATKFLEITVTGALNDADAKTHAMSIANSPLVKTAIAGEDPNWGRVVMAIGKSGAPADRDTLSISFGDVKVASNGWVDPDYREEQGAAIMKQENISMTVDLGMGTGTATVWTCDLTHGYISINADYRS